MNLSTSETDGITVIALEGSVLGGPDATALNDALHKLVEKKKKKLVLDLAEVHTMNSSGLTMLIGALTTVRNAGGLYKVVKNTLAGIASEGTPAEPILKGLERYVSIWEAFLGPKCRDRMRRLSAVRRK